jgi:acetyl esterase/lipase
MKFTWCLFAWIVAWSVADVSAQQKAGPFAGRLSDKIALEADLEYGRAGERSLKLDLLRPKDQGDKALPVVVFVHGGAWRQGNKESVRNRLNDLVASGNYVGATIGYRLTPEACWPAQIHDCKAAIRWLRANAEKYHLDAQHIGAWGSSAGGHLVSMLGTSGDVKELEGDCGTPGYSSRVQCVVDFCGPSDFLKELAEGHILNTSDSVLGQLFGGPPLEKKEVARAASPVIYASPDDPPFLVVNGTADQTVPISQAEAMVAALAKVNVPVTFIRMAGGGHFIGGPEIHARVRTFFDKQLRGQPVEVSDAPIVAPAPPQK